jgi:pyruvate dehydrogenase E2 component (dihydrolipoamide acetyltransferase)
MLKEIIMPNLGTTTDEIKIVRWLKSENEIVKRGEPIFEVETDKAVMEVESFMEGYLKKIVVPEGGTAAVGAVVAFIGEEGYTLDGVGAKADVGIAVVSETAKTPPLRVKDGVRVSPLVRNIADKLGVDLNTVIGTGINGMILKADVEKRGKDRAEKPDQITLAAEPATGKKAPAFKRGEFIPFNTVGKLTAKNMAESKGTIPHAYYQVDVSAKRIIDARAVLGGKISYNTMIIKAVAEALKTYPRAAAIYKENGIRLPDEVNIGLAVDVDGNLFVPVLKNVDKKTVFELDDNIKTIITKARQRKLSNDDMTGGVLTVTNLGSSGIDAFHAVIKPSESAILAIGRIGKVPVVENGMVVPGAVMKICLSQDHRVVNGLYSAAFLIKIKEMLETWTI